MPETRKLSIDFDSPNFLSYPVAAATGIGVVLGTKVMIMSV